MGKIIVRPGLTLIINGEEISRREPLHKFEHQLPTEIGDDLRPSRRVTMVEVYDPGVDVPMLYELGIPVVETEDKWHINVCQKVPLNIDRDNVTPAYLRQVRVAVFNQMHRHITEEDATTTWVTEASSDKECSPEAAETLRIKRYGERSVASDRSVEPHVQGLRGDPFSWSHQGSKGEFEGGWHLVDQQQGFSARWTQSRCKVRCGLSTLGARIKRAALDDPEWFRRFDWR